MALTTACKTCSLHSLCLPLSLNNDDIERLDKIIRRGRPLKKGEHLFHQGERFTSVFAVRTGTLKTYTLTSEGEEQITGFHLPSEIVGLNAYDMDSYPASAKALESTNVCEIPIERLDELCNHMPELRRQMMRVMGKEIRSDERMMLLLSKKTAEERLASYLLNLSQRFSRRGYSGAAFRLAMSRADMANYLGLAVETVSRVFTRFQKQDIIDLQGNAKDIRIVNAEALAEAAALTAVEKTDIVLCRC